MANITKRKNRDGSTSYRVKVSAGLGADGRYVYRSTTFTPPPKLTARQTEKAVQDFARDFEQRVQRGLFAETDLTVDGLAQKWLTEFCEPQLKPHTVEDYKKLMPRVSAAIGHIKLSKLRSRAFVKMGNIRRKRLLLRRSPKEHALNCKRPPGYRRAQWRLLCKGAPFPNSQPKR